MLFFFISSLVLILKYPKLFKSTSILALFLFISSFTYEIIALKLGHWEFARGNHIGYISIFNTTFPIEEGAFLIFTPYFVSLIHEVFSDNKRSK